MNLPDEALRLYGCPVCGERHLVWTFQLVEDKPPERVVLCSKVPKDGMWMLTVNG